MNVLSDCGDTTGSGTPEALTLIPCVAVSRVHWDELRAPALEPMKGTEVESEKLGVFEMMCRSNTSFFFNILLHHFV